MNPLSSNVMRIARRRAPGVYGAAHAAHAAHATRRPHWLNSERLRIYGLVALACYGLFLAVYVYRAEWQHRPDFGPLALDFLPFWSASFLALHRHAIDAYNLVALTAVETEAISRSPGILPWLYPPTFLLVVYPLALLPFKIAAAAFLGGTLAFFVSVVRAIVPGRQTVLLALAFPGSALVMVCGQNGLLTASLIGLGLVLLRRRPVLAGICFGLLCIKPHLAVLLPLALLCSRSWRALGAMALTAATLLAVSVLLFGTATLLAFLHNAGFISSLVESGRAALARIPTVFAMATLAHVPRAWAYAAQGVAALAAAAAVCHAWGRDCSYALRAAVLVCASLLVSPYLFDYDLTWLGVLIAWYARHGLARGWKRYEREWLVGLWFAPIAGVFVVAQLKFQFMPLVMIATLWMLTRRIARERQESVVLQDDNGEGGNMSHHNNRNLISLVVPFYNEGEAVGHFFAQIVPVLEAIEGIRFEIVCVNDGSKDSTLEQLIAVSAKDARVRVVDLTRNFGKEAALTAGLDEALGDAVIPIDADLQDPPSLIPVMIEHWRAGADVVAAKRSDRASDSFAKRTAAALYYRVHNALSDLKVPENVGDFRLMDRVVVNALKRLPERRRFMKGLFAWVGYRTVIVEYQREARSAGHSKFSGWRLWNFALEGITGFSTVPLRCWTYIGLVIAAVAFGYGGFMIGRTLIFGNPVPGYASLLCVLLFMGGIELIGIGVVGEYIGRIYYESKQRPVYLVRRRYQARSKVSALPLREGVTRAAAPLRFEHPRKRVTLRMRVAAR